MPRVPTSEELGRNLPLRERKKLQVRRDIVDSAAALFSERDFDDVSIDEIADGAGVSRRTFFRYFDAKEDVLLADMPALSEAFHNALTALGNPDIVDGIRTVLMRVTGLYAERRSALESRSRTWDTTPAVQNRSLRLVYDWHRDLSTALAERFETDPMDPATRLIAYASVGAFQIAVQRWVVGEFQTELVDEFTKTFDVADPALTVLVQQLANR